MSIRNKNIEDLLADDSFIRWINEEADTMEVEMWEEWIRRDPVNASTYQQAIELYRSLRFREEQTDTLHELGKLERSVSRAGMSRVIQKKRRPYTPAVLVMAALMLMVTLFIYKSDRLADPIRAVPEKEFTEVSTAYGQIQKISFPDGSAVTLNANSSLKYTKPFLADQVDFYIEGEAYFSIRRSADEDKRKRKIAIHTTDGTINILGTDFNVNTRKGQTEVVLDLGEIELVKSSDEGNRVVMTPGQLGRISAEADPIEVHDVRTELYTSWTGLIWIFENTSLSEIAERIESTYGLQVIILDENAMEMKFSGTAPNQNLTVLLEGLKVLLDTPIEAGSDSIIIGN